MFLRRGDDVGMGLSQRFQRIHPGMVDLQQHDDIGLGLLKVGEDFGVFRVGGEDVEANEFQAAGSVGGDGGRQGKRCFPQGPGVDGHAECGHGGEDPAFPEKEHNQCQEAAERSLEAEMIEQRQEPMDVAQASEP